MARHSICLSKTYPSLKRLSTSLKSHLNEFYKYMPQHGKEWRPEYFDNLVEHLANPLDQRSVAQFAKDNNISEGTVYDYKRIHSEELWNAVAIVAPKYKAEIRSTLYKSVIANMKKSFNDRRLAAQLIGELVERSEVASTIKTPEEKRARIAEIMSKLSANMSDNPKNIEQASDEKTKD